MSLKSRYSEDQIKAMDLDNYMRESFFDDVVHYNSKLFRVAIYARESTNHEDQKAALENQTKRLEDFVTSKEHFIFDSSKHFFIERGISGRTTDSRIAFNTMIEAAKRGEFDILVVQDVCRFARNVKELFIYIDMLKEYHVSVLILDGQYWTYNMSETDIVRLSVDGGMAQGESMRTSKRVNNGVGSYRERGQLVVSGLFGYDLKKAVVRKDNSLTINPINGLTVKKIFDLYAGSNKNERMGSSTIANYLNANGYKTDNETLSWTASKVNRVLKNEKYMGYMLYGKFKVVDTMKKKKVATHIQPIREDIIDSEGNVIEKCNLVKGNWEPIVSEEQWWLAHEIRCKNSATYINSANGNVKTGLRASSDVIANKAFCQCGYSLSQQYIHVATEDKPAQFRYTCRCQINNNTPKYRQEHNLPLLTNACDLGSVSEMKMWLMSLKVFEHLFTNDKEAILQTLKIIEVSKKEAMEGGCGYTLASLEKELGTINTQLDNIHLMRASEEIDINEYKRLTQTLRDKKESIERRILDKKKEEAKNHRDLFDIQAISDKLNTYVDLSALKVSEEMLEMFVERIVRRENDEYVWEMNLSGVRSSALQYRIKEYSEEHAQALQSDNNFNIVKSFMIPLSECEKYCTEMVKRRFIKKYWNPLTVKIAIK